MALCDWNPEEFYKAERSTYCFRFPVDSFLPESREDLIQNLCKLYVAISERFELCVIEGENDCRVVRCESSSRARAILFGACDLTVTQTIEFQGNEGVARLEWSHPQPEESIQDIAYIVRGGQKRARFVSIFNGCWATGCQTLILESVAKEYNGNPEELTHFLNVIKDKLFFGYVACSTEDALDYPSTLPKSLSKRSSAALNRVRFSGKDVVTELPLSQEEREARMGSGASAVFPNGYPKPLRSVKTGGLIWYVDCPEEMRRVIAPFNYQTSEEDRFTVDLETRKAIAPFNYEVSEPLPVKKRPIINEESSTKVVPCSPSDALCKPKGILKGNDSTKRLKYEVDRRIIAPFNYGEIDS